MISKRLRVFLYDIIHHFLVLCAAILFLLAVSLSVLHELLPLLSEHKHLIANTLGELIGAQVEFETMQVGWHHLQPEIQLQNVQIENAAHQPLMRIPQVHLRMSLIASLIARKPVISLLQINQWQVSVYQNAQTQWQIAGIDHFSTPQPSENKIQLDDFFSALSQIQHLKLNECHIDIQALNQPHLILLHTNLDWTFTGGSAQIKGNTNVVGPSNVPLQYAIELQGDSEHLTTRPITAKLYFKINALSLAPWLKNIHWHDLTWQQGTVQGSLWANWQKDHWQQVATQIQITDLNLQKLNQSKTWSIQSALTKLDALWQDKKWTAQLHSTKGRLMLGDLFRESMPFEQIILSGTQQTDTQGAYHLRLNNATIQTTEADIHAKLKLTGTHHTSPEMHLLATIDMPTFNHISHYLPAGIMTSSLVQWLDHAILTGKHLHAQMLWRGTLDQFPFHDQSGTMQITGQVQGITLDYTPGWPKMSDVNADLYFTSHGMHVIATHGFLADMPITQVTADIPFQKSTSVSIHGLLNTDLKNAWAFLADSKCAKTLVPLLEHTDATGPANIALNLAIPLGSTDPITYQGQVQFNHDQLSLRDIPITLTDFLGNIAFTDHDLTGALFANWLTMPWHITLAKKNNEQKIQLDFSGTAPLDHWISQNFEFASAWFSGQPNMTGHIDIAPDTQNIFHLQLTSDLKNLSVDTPFNFNKTKDAPTPFNLILDKKNDAPLSLNANWSAPQGSVAVSHKHDHWFINTPIGNAQIIEPSHAESAWQINLSDLNLTHLDEEIMHTANKTKSMPAMDIQARSVQLKSMLIPFISAQLRPKQDGMIIKNLLLRTEPFTISAQGVSNNSLDRTTLQGNLTTDHLENTLSMLGLGHLFDAHQANIHFDLSWPGTLFQFDRNRLSGLLNFTTHEGIFKNISDQTNNKINLGRMLSILSVQALPQHLSSHFNDMTGKGFAFGKTAGSLALTPTHLNQMNINIHGTVAEVLLQGCVNLENEQLNLVTKINPNVTGSLPVLAALAGGPILGAIGFVANQFLGPMVGKLSESYYTVQGPAHEPQTTKVSRLKASNILSNCN